MFRAQTSVVLFLTKMLCNLLFLSHFCININQMSLVLK